MKPEHQKSTPCNTIMNQGHTLAHPLQSRYAIARRLMVANPTLSLFKYKAFYERVGRFESADSFEQLNPSHPFSLCFRVRQCTACAKQLFHPAVYGLPALGLCPIHHTQFSEKCPDCGEYWNHALTARSPHCQTCGSPPYETLGHLSLKKAVYRNLTWLDKWLVSCENTRETQLYPALLDIYQQLRPTVGIERPLFTQPYVQHSFYVAFESQERGGTHNRRLKKLNVVTVDQPLKTRITCLTRWHPPLFHGISYDSENAPPYIAPKSVLISFVGLALRRILRWQRDLVGIKHTLNWHDIRAIRPEQIREGSPPCMLCLAFSFWCQAITLKLIRPDFGGQPGEHELCRFTGYTTYPRIPQGVYIEGDHGKLYRPSASFERWLFLRSTDMAFSEFVGLAAWIYDQTADENVRFRQTTYSQRHSFCFPDHPSDLLEVTKQKKQLRAKYWADTRLTSLTLPQNRLKRIMRCPAILKCDCERIWSIDPDPASVGRSKINELVGKILQKNDLIPYRYQWTITDYTIERLARAQKDMVVLPSCYHSTLWRGSLL